MATLYDAATGAATEIPDGDAHNAVLSGRYGFRPGEKVVLYGGPDGEGRTVPTEQAIDLIRKGYTWGDQSVAQSDMLEDNYGKVGGTLLAGGAGVARGLTLGLSDRVARNFGAEASTLRTLQEGAPLASTVGEVGGSIAAVLATGGAGGAGRLAAGATGFASRGLVGRAAAKALEMGIAGAIEGGAFGAGKNISENALGRADLTAESLIANAGMGALVGGGVGGLIGGGSVLAGAGVKAGAKAISDKLGSGSVKDWLEGLAGERALKATIGQNKKAFSQLESKDLADKAGKYLLEEIGLGTDDALAAAGNTNEVIAEKLAARRDLVGKKIDDIVTKLDDATAAGEGVAKRVRGELVADRIENEVLKNIDPVAQKGTYNTIKEVADGYRAQQGPISFADAAKMRRSAQLNANYDAAVPKPTQQAWQDVAKVWNKTIDDAADPVLKGMGEQTSNLYKATRDEFSLVQRLTNYAENRVAANSANRVVSPSDYGIGGAAGLLTGNPLTGAASAIGHKLVRERGSAVAANLAYKASRLGMIQNAAQATTMRIDDAVAGFVTRAMEGGARVSSAPAATQTLENVSFMPKVASAEMSQPKVAKGRADAAKSRAKEIAELANNPERMADRISASLAGIDDAAPGVSGQAAMKAAKVVSYLNQKAPKPTRSTNTLQPLLDNWKPSEEEASKFERHVRAAMDPMSVLDDLNKGTLTPEAAEAFRTLYPKLHELTVSKIAEKLATAKKQLPYEDRVNLSLLLGTPVDDSMRPDFIARTQQLWAKKPTEGGGRKTANMGKLELAGNMRSDAQKLEEKR